MSSTFLDKAFSNFPAFRHADPDGLRVLAGGARRMVLSARQHLFHLGESADHFFWIETGSVTLYLPSYNGDERVFQVLGNDCLVAATVMFADDRRYPVSAQANERTVLHRLDCAPLIGMAQRSSEFSCSLLRIVAGQMTQAIGRIDLLTIANSMQRLVTYLVNLYIEQGSAWLTLPTHHRVLARQLNMTPENLSRMLGGFRRDGLIGGRNRDLVLLDVEALCKQARLPPPDMKLRTQHTRSSRDEALFSCCTLH